VGERGKRADLARKKVSNPPIPLFDWYTIDISSPLGERINVLLMYY